MSVNRYNSTTGELERIAGGLLYADAPIGSIIPYGGTTAPDGFLLCQGQAVSRTTYADLFAVIGTSFGEGDGTTTFNIPDLRGEFLRGAGTNSHANQGDGGSVGEHQDGTILDGNGTLDNQMRINKHNSSLFDKVHSSNTPVAYVTGSAAQSSNGVYGTVRPTNTSVNYIIKSKQVAVPTDIQSAIKEQNSYSTDEVDTGKVWIDGKKIYRKVIPVSNVGSISSGGTKIVSFSRTANNVKDVTFAQCLMKNNAGYDYPNFAQVVAVDGDGIRLQWLSGGALTTGNVIIEYTKTT